MGFDRFSLDKAMAAESSKAKKSGVYGEELLRMAAESSKTKKGGVDGGRVAVEVEAQ